MMVPDFAPAHGMGPAFDNYGADFEFVTAPADAVAELIVVGEAVGESFEATNFAELLATDEHDRAEGEIHGLEGAGLEDLAPEIDVYGEGFPGHGASGGVCQDVERVYEAGLRILERGDGVAEVIGRGFDVGIADDEEVVAGEFFDFAKFRDFSVCAA